MALVVNSNIASLNTQRNLGKSNSSVGKSVEKLSSGLRINRAADDAAGFAIATKANAQVRGLNQAIRNANNAISLVQTAEGGVNNLSNILHRLRELAVQSSSDDNTASDREMMTSEANNLIAEFTRISNTTEFNGMALLDGSFSGKYFQVGANYAQSLTFNLNDARGKSIGGRAQYDADIADGVATATDANFGGNELKVNGTGIQATNASDDQYSVLDISSEGVNAASFSGLVSNASTLMFMINSVEISFLSSEITAGLSNHSMVAIIVSKINAASITGVTARAGIGSKNSTWVLQAAGGVKLDLATSVSGVSFGSAMGLQSVSALFGSVASANVNYNGESSALAKAVAINSIKSTSKVTATARANVVTGASAIGAASLASGDLYINGVNIGGITVTASDSNGALVSAINAKTSSTGVTASTNADGKLILTATDGRNITITGNESAVLTSTLGIDADWVTNSTAVFRSTVRLNSEDEIALTGTLSDLYDGGTTDAQNNTKTTDTSKSVAVDLATYNVAGMSLDTQETAQAAVLTIDAALNDLNSIRSQIGAIQNRLEFMISNLEIASENMAASESRIKDADFAFDTTKFTGNQVLLQAGTAMLAQANTMPQMALQLLR